MSAECWPARRPAAVAWDLDGTLIDSAADLRTALNRMLASRDLPPLGLAAVRSMIGHGAARLLQRGFTACGQALDAARAASLVPEFLEFYRPVATLETVPYPGITKLLARLHDAGIAQGVCTNKPEAISREIIAGLGLDRYFNSVVGGDTTSRRKPDPLPLQVCLETLGVAPADSLMIGDSSADVAAARAAGVTVTVVEWGYAQEAPGGLGADHLLSLAEGLMPLPAWLQRTGPDSPGEHG